MIGCTLNVRVIPNAPRDEIAGRLGDAIKLKIHAPALEGRANEAVCAFLAVRLNVARRSVTLIRGETSRHKVIRVEGLAEADVISRLGL